MKIHSQTSNHLFKRKDITVVLTSKTNPGFAEASKTIAEHLKVPEEKIVIRSINNQYGAQEFTVSAFVYDSAESKTEVERKPKVKKEAAK